MPVAPAPSADAIFSGAAPDASPRPPAARSPATSFRGRPPFLAEAARYRVSYSLTGEVGQALIRFAPAAGSGQMVVRASGIGQGAVLGFGKTEKRVESEFDTRALQSMRWTMTRTSGSETVVDIAEQPKAGAVSVLRKRAGQPDQNESMTRATSVLDPLGLLLRLRVAPLTAPSTFEVLDGRALWLLTLSAARPTKDHLLQLDGRAEPIYWDGSPDRERTGRNFSLFLNDDGFRTPMRLTVPFGPGEARAELVQLTRASASRWRFIRRLLPSSPRLSPVKQKPLSALLPTE
ncbi:MAG TPA: DUF3108 domain-containing protein [Polyangia bacterium]